MTSLKQSRSRNSSPSGFQEFLHSKGVKNLSLYSMGRVALRHGLRSLGMGGGDRILVPSYICEMVIPPILDIGMTPLFYRVNDDLTPNSDDLGRLADERVRAILVVDYFGFPQDIGRIRSLTREKMLVVEDNAHSALSEHGGKLLGTYGDIGFTSFRKTLPCPDGSALYLNDTSEVSANATVTGFSLGPTSISERIRYLMWYRLGGQSFLHFPQRLTKSVYGLGARDEYADDGFKTKADERMTLLSWTILNSLKLTRIASKRIAEYREIAELLSHAAGTALLFPTLPEGVVPWAVPLTSLSPEGTRAILSRGLTTFNWPPLPTGILGGDRLENALSLRRKIVFVRLPTA